MRDQRFWLTICAFVSVGNSMICTSLDDPHVSSSAATGSDDGQPQQQQQELVVEMISGSPETCDRTTKQGDTVVIHYKAFFSNGTYFDSTNRERAAPFKFRFGAGRVIKGWEQGLLGMCAGEIRRLTVPPHLGYGPNGFGKVIGPDETLVFEVELMEFTETETPQQSGIFTFDDIDLDSDKLLSRDEVEKYLLDMAVKMAEIADQVDTPEGLRKLVDKVMKSNDVDGDGFVDEQEFYRPYTGNPKEEL